MLPGDLLCKFMKERLEESLEFFKDMVKRDLDRQPEKVNLQVLLPALPLSSADCSHASVTLVCLTGIFL